MTITTSGPIGAPPPPYPVGPLSDVKYSDLLVDAGAYAGRDDVAEVFPLLVRLAEAKLNRNLRTGYQEVVTILPMVNGVAVLPDNFLEARTYEANGATFTRFAISAGAIHATDPWSGDMTLLYYAKIPPLTPDNPTNWLLALDYNVYLYALVCEICIWAKNPELYKAAESMRDSAISTVMLNDENARWGRARVVNRDQTP